MVADIDVGWQAGEWLAFDLETTGVDRFVDVPVSFALVRVRAGRVVRSMSSLVDPGREIPPEATAVHGISTARARAEGMPLAEAVGLLGAEVAAASAQGVPVVGMKLDYDLTMLDVQHRLHVGEGLGIAGFEGPVLDALVLDRHFDRYRPGRRTLADLCELYDVVIGQAHDAAADAAAAAGVVQAICAKYPALCAMDPLTLYRRQAEWHGEWVRSFEEWRRRRGLPPLDEREGEWPIARAVAPFELSVAALR